MLEKGGEKKHVHVLKATFLGRKVVGLLGRISVGPLGLHKSLMLAQYCHKHAVKHVSTSEEGTASAQGDTLSHGCYYGSLVSQVFTS